MKRDPYSTRIVPYGEHNYHPRGRYWAIIRVGDKAVLRDGYISRSAARDEKWKIDNL